LQGDILLYVGKAAGKVGLPDRLIHHDAKVFKINRSEAKHTNS